MIFYKFYVLNATFIVKIEYFDTILTINAAFIPRHKNSRKPDVAACSNYHSSEINAESHSKALRYVKFIILKIFKYYLLN